MTSLKQKILLLTLLPLFLSLIAIGGFSIYNKYNAEKELVVNRLISYRTLLESGTLSLESLRDKSKLEVLLDEKIGYAEIIKKDFSVLYSTESSAIAAAGKEDKTALSDAFLGIETIKEETRDGKRALIYISPIIINGRIVAAIHQALSFEESNKRTYQYAALVALLMALAMALCYASIAILLKRAVLRNINKLKNATIEMKKGNLAAPVEISSNDEIGDLAGAFNDMRTEVRSSRARLEEYNEELEGQVHQRTLDMESKLGELERMNKFMIDRELKMVELKKELARLAPRPSSQP